MEAKCLSKPQRLGFDLITTLPQPIIETILCLLPIEEAARTSVLSKEWRYKWITIPKLVFRWSIVSKTTNNETRTSDITSARKNMDERCKLFYVVYQVLLLHQGPIHEFTLEMDADFRCFELDQIILYLSRNHALKKLSLDLDDNHYYKLPLCAFSFHQLTHLDLAQIDLDHQPISGGFPNLRSLNLYHVSISTKALLHLLSNCPSLTTFILHNNGSIAGEKDCTFIELFKCLPVLEHLDTNALSFVEMLVLDSVPKELPILLIHLKYLCVKEVGLFDDGLRFLAALIKCSPNLEKIYLELEDCYDEDIEICSRIFEEYSDVSLEHLNELEIAYFRNIKPEIEFVKFMLARSPKLKKVWIWGVDEKFKQGSEMLKTLVRAQCASLVEIVVECLG